MATRWRDALDWINGSSEEPLRLVRLIAGGLLLFGTVVAVALALSGIAPRAILLVGAFWAIYGLISGFTSGVLEPLIKGLAEALQSVGLIRAGGGYSAIETLVARGHLARERGGAVSAGAGAALCHESGRPGTVNGGNAATKVACCGATQR